MTARPSLATSAGALAVGCAFLGLSLAGAGAGADAAADSTEPFPHEEHAGLFPLCTGCHSGITSGDSATFYPEPRSCGDCHDGEQQERVDWSGPERAPSGLAFDHVEHASEMQDDGEDEAGCADCHTPAGGERMAVRGRGVAERCLSCHEHGARAHYVDARCSVCHEPLARTGFSRRRIEALPEPETHEEEDFLVRAHGEAAAERGSCQTCHTRERCTACHVEGARREAVAALPPAPPGMELPALAARYPTPESHRSEKWIESHGGGTAAGACSTCHTRQSCTTCHRDAPPRAVVRLPDADRSAAPGAEVTRRVPDSHRAPAFATEHGDRVASDPASCTSCHSEATCADCHVGRTASARAGRPERTETAASLVLHPGAPAVGAAAGPAPAPASRVDTTAADTIASVDTVTAGDTTGAADSVSRFWTDPGRRSRPGGFHPQNFMARHSAAAFGNRMECSNCHSTAAFCRECHRQLGMGSSGRVGPGFHDAQPLWLLRHGQAARQALESCASCHRQRDCVQCHSTTGAFSVNPHGPDFDAQRYADRNRQVCRACHLSDPLEGGGS